MTLITALELAGNYPDDILISSAKQNNGKYSAFCHMTRNGQIHKLMLSSEPIFDTEQEGNEYLHKLAEACKNKYND